MPASASSPGAQFAANVERLREARGMTQEQLGWAAGLHQTAVARIESGERRPTFATIIKLSRGLEVRPAELFADID